MVQLPRECLSCERKSESLFQFCHLRELREIAEKKSAVKYAAGQELYGHGQDPKAVFCIFSGKIKLVKPSVDKKVKITGLARPGDILGAEAVVGKRPYSVSAIALEPVEACAIPASAFLGIMEENELMKQGIMKQFSERLREFEKKVADLSYKPVRDRLVDALLLLHETYQRAAGEDQFTIYMGREDLASLVGTAKETVIRLLSELKKEGYVETKGSRITILEFDKLKQEAK